MTRTSSSNLLATSIIPKRSFRNEDLNSRLGLPEFVVYRSTWFLNQTILSRSLKKDGSTPYVVILSWVNGLEPERYSRLHNPVNQLEWLLVGLAHPIFCPRHVFSNYLSSVKIRTPDLDWPHWQFVVYCSTSWMILKQNYTIQVTEKGSFNYRPYVVIMHPVLNQWIGTRKVWSLRNSVNQLEWEGLAHPTFLPRQVFSNNLSGMKIQIPDFDWPQFVAYRSTSWMIILNPNNIQVTEKGWLNSRPYVVIIHPVLNQWIRYSRYALHNDHDCIIL